MTASLLRVYVPGADWLARWWADYHEGCDARRRRLKSEAAEARFEDWLEAQFAAGNDLTEALRAADHSVKLDFLRAQRLGFEVGHRYVSAFGEIDINRVFT